MSIYSSFVDDGGGLVVIGASGVSSSLKNSGEKVVEGEVDLDDDDGFIAGGGGGETLLRIENFLCAARLIKLVKFC